MADKAFEVDLSTELNSISNYEGGYVSKNVDGNDVITYTNKPILDFRFIISKAPIQEYRESFARIISILNNHYSFMVTKNASLMAFIESVQIFHFILTEQPKKPINIFGQKLETLFRYFNLLDIPIQPVTREDKFVDAYGNVLWKYLHSASILSESSINDKVTLRQSTILYLSPSINTENLYQNEKFSSKVVKKSTIAFNNSRRNINLINDDGCKLSMDQKTKELQTYFLKIVAQFNNALLCGRCYKNFISHNVVENLVIPAYFTRSMISTVFNLHNLVNITKENPSEAYNIHDFCKDYNLLLITATKIFLNKSIVFNHNRKTQNEIILSPVKIR